MWRMSKMRALLESNQAPYAYEGKRVPTPCGISALVAEMGVEPTISSL